MFPKVILKSGKEKSIQRRHPWIFSGAVYGVSREINDGEMVDVVDSKNNHLTGKLIAAMITDFMKAKA